MNAELLAFPTSPLHVTHAQREDAATVVFDGSRLAIEDVCRLAETQARATLSEAPAFRGRIRRGAEFLDRLLREGRGGLFVTAHVGCLEMCQASAESVPGLRLTVLVHTVHAERFNRVLARLAPERRVRLLQVSEITPATAVLLAERVAAGEFVAIAGDRVPLEAGRTSAVTVPFLGRPAAFPTGAYLLASLLKCPVFMLGCIRQGDAHEVVFERLAEEVRLPRGDRLGACARHAAVFAARLETLLARAPYEWFNFFPFWDQPGGLPAPPARADARSTE